MNDSQVVVAMIPVTHKFSSKTLVDRGPFLSCLFMSSNLQTICVEWTNGNWFCKADEESSSEKWFQGTTFSSENLSKNNNLPHANQPLLYFCGSSLVPEHCHNHIGRIFSPNNPTRLQALVVRNLRVAPSGTAWHFCRQAAKASAWRRNCVSEIRIVLGSCSCFSMFLMSFEMLRCYIVFYVANLRKPLCTKVWSDMIARGNKANPSLRKTKSFRSRSSKESFCMQADCICCASSVDMRQEKQTQLECLCPAGLCLPLPGHVCLASVPFSCSCFPIELLLAPFKQFLVPVDFLLSSCWFLLVFFTVYN